MARKNFLQFCFVHYLYPFVDQKELLAVTHTPPLKKNMQHTLHGTTLEDHPDALWLSRMQQHKGLQALFDTPMLYFCSVKQCCLLMCFQVEFKELIVPLKALHVMRLSYL